MFLTESRTMSLRYIVLILSPLFVCGCGDNFSPVTVYRPELNAYCVLFPDDDEIYVRVLKTHLNLADRVDEPVDSAVVHLIAEDGEITELNETTVTSGSRTVAIYAGRTRISAFSSYRLVVDKPGFPELTASTQVLGHAVIQLDLVSQDMMKNLSHSFQDIYYYISFQMRPAWILATFDLGYSGLNSQGDTVAGGRHIGSYFLPLSGSRITLQFSRETFISGFNQVSAAAAGLESKHYYATLTVTQIDSVIYKYYSASTGFNVPNTLRQEGVIFSNVSNGMGLFGSASIDSSVFVIQ